jgi:hypothetical protein
MTKKLETLLFGEKGEGRLKQLSILAQAQKELLLRP